MSGAAIGASLQERSADIIFATDQVEVEIAHAGRFAFSDGCFPSSDCNPPTTLTQPESHAIVRRWVLPFVQRFLAGDARYAPFLDNVPPGVEVTQER